MDEILGNVVDSTLGGNQQKQSANPLGALINSLGGGDQAKGGALLTAAMCVLQQQGGLPAVLDMFRGKGMAREADSWVSTGANVGGSADQVRVVRRSAASRFCGAGLASRFCRGSAHAAGRDGVRSRRPCGLNQRGRTELSIRLGRECPLESDLPC